MFTSEQINLLLKQILSRLSMMNPDIARNPGCSDGKEAGENESSSKNALSAGYGCNTHNSRESRCVENKIGNSGGKEGENSTGKPVVLSPSTALVTAGLLTGALVVDSVLVDRNQVVQIVLEGTLKVEKTKEKTKMDTILEEIGSMPFDEVMKALLNKYT